MSENRPLTAGELERILEVYLRLIRELPPDTPAGHLDGRGQLHVAPDIGAKLIASRDALSRLRRIRKPDG